MPRTVSVESRKGTQTVRTDLTLDQAVAVLRQDRNPSQFVADLLAHYRRWGSQLTAGRRDWLVVIAQQTLDRAAQPRPSATIGDLAGIHTLFLRVAGVLKYPRIRLQAADGQPVVLSIADSTNGLLGSVTVTTGEPYGTPGSFLGRIEPDGCFRPAGRGGRPGVIDLLRRFAADPAGVAAEYGRLTRACSFCKTPLTDPRSLEVGYGPVCAENYGLPWGGDGRRAAEARLERALNDERADREAEQELEGFASDPDYHRLPESIGELTLAELMDRCGPACREYLGLHSAAV